MNNVGIKICIQCKQEKHISDFYTRKGKPGAACKSCCKERMRQYYLNNAEYLRGKEFNRMEKNRREAADRTTKICSKCKIEKTIDCFHDRKKGSIDGKQPKCKECASEIAKRYYKDNTEEITERNNRWADANIERKRKNGRDYYYSNKERLTKHARYRRKTDPVVRVAYLMRKRVRNVLVNRGWSKTETTMKLMGCTYECAKAYLESKFLPGMGWHNSKLWHIDHIIPLASAKTVDEVKNLFHYTNLQPLWALDNIRKHAKMPADEQL